MKQTRDILGQEPEVKQVECIGDAEGYVVYSPAIVMGTDSLKLDRV